MGSYRVKVGQEVGQNGVTFREGDVLQIPDAVALGLRDKVEPCTPEGVPHQPLSQYELDLATARSHERISLIEAELGRRKQTVKEAEDQLATETRRLATLLQQPAPLTPMPRSNRP